MQTTGSIEVNFSPIMYFFIHLLFCILQAISCPRPSWCENYNSAFCLARWGKVRQVKEYIRKWNKKWFA